MILLWGIATDDPLAAVAAALDRRGAPFLFVDQVASLRTELELEVSGTVAGRLAVAGEGVDLGDVGAAYLRPYDPRRVALAGAGRDEPAAGRRVAALGEALSAWAEVSPGLVVNRPSAMASNGSKPYQAALIEARGFRVPATVVTTDPDVALGFLRGHGDVIYKSVSGVRSIVTRLDAGRLPDLPDVANAPTQFQAYVPGCDVRVHVVGSEVFASEVESDADDYRYAGRRGIPISIRAAPVLPALERACVRLARDLGLAVAGIDLRITPEGDCYCFEANPSPGFSFYEEATGQPIAGAVARLLANADLGAVG